MFRYQIPEDWPYQEARHLFKEPVVLADEEEPELKWSSPDEEVIYFLGYEHDGHFTIFIMGFWHIGSFFL